MDEHTFDRQRRDYAEALAWVGQLMAPVRPEQLDGPTPCREFDVRTLMGHLLGTAHRGLATARGEPSRGIPHVVTGVPDEDLAGAYAALADEIGAAWSRLGGADPVTAPWGRCTALEAARGFTVETLTHGWDLAVATGQPSDALDAVARRCLAAAAGPAPAGPAAAAAAGDPARDPAGAVAGADIVPARLRGVMYDDPVTGPPPASATERLAHLLGHRRDTAPAPADPRSGELGGLVRDCPWLLEVLAAVRDAGLPDAWVGAGALRDVVWGRRFGDGFDPGQVRDVDVAFFDPADLSGDNDRAATGRLRRLAPGIPWEATNQAAVHTWYARVFGTGPVAPLRSTADGVATWPETATAVAVRLDADGTVQVCAPCGLDDLLDGVWRHNPRRVGVALSRERLARHDPSWRWPGVTVIAP
jgi:uncharacterized protein (TIGR03086 family)